MVAERKYTDRDVRENESLRQLAIDYLMDYGGDFEPLVNAIEMLKSGSQLPTNVIRVVLNCMRHDRNFAESMPEPVRPKLELVVDEKPKKKKKKLPWNAPCDNLQPHDGHGWREPEDIYNSHWCEGVPFPIMREPFWAGAVSRRQFVLARGGKLLHYASLELGSGVYWWPPHHNYGMAKPKKLAIKTLCRYPSVINDPILLGAEDASLLVSTGPLLEKQIAFCPHCINEIETEVEAHGAFSD